MFKRTISPMTRLSSLFISVTTVFSETTLRSTRRLRLKPRSWRVEIGLFDRILNLIDGVSIGVRRRSCVG